jgi:hypothetical protein
VTDDPLASVATLPGVAAAVAEARAAVDGLLGHRVLRRRAGLVATESALRGARASAELEGVFVPLDALRALVRDSATLAPGSDSATLAPGSDNATLAPGPDPEVVWGALRVSVGIGPLVPTWRRAPLQALARLHVLAAGDAVAEAERGRPRRDAGSEVSVRLGALAHLATTSSAPAPVVAAVVHGELLTLQPFASLNGVVARAAQRLVLIDRGFDAKAVSVPEVGHVDAGDGAYATAAKGYATGGADGVAAWVRHVADALALGAREGLAVCESVQRGG